MGKSTIVREMSRLLSDTCAICREKHDCAPFLDRPRRVEPRILFAYFANREELEYSLESDKNDEFIPEEDYKAPQHSRWNTPSTRSSPHYALDSRDVTRLQVLHL